jgi:hypothetical protein
MLAVALGPPSMVITDPGPTDVGGAVGEVE